MRAAAEIEPLALRVDVEVLAFGNRVDEFELVGLALVGEHLLGLVACPDVLGEGTVLRDDLAHLRLDGDEVFRREGLGPREIVIEAVLDHRADGDLRAGKERLHGLRQHVRGIVPDEFQRARIVAGEKLDLGVPGDRFGKIDDRAVERHRDGALGEGLGDAFGDLAAGDAGGVGARGAIGKCQGNHETRSPCSLLPTKQVSGPTGSRMTCRISRRQVRPPRR